MVSCKFINYMVLIILSVLGICSLTVKGATLAEEQSDNEVLVSFYMLPESKWESEVKLQFRDAVVKEANRNCSGTPDKCGLRYWNQPEGVNGTKLEWGFNSSSFVITSPIVSSRSSLSFKFVLLYPEGVNLTADATTRYVLPKKATQEIIKSIREKVNEETGYAIAAIDEDGYGPPPNTRLNVIIITIACIILVIIAAITIGLHIWDQKKQKRERKRGKKVAPVEAETSYNPEAGNGVKYVHEKERPPPQYDPYSKKTSNYFNSDEYADPDVPRIASHHLPPVDAEDGDQNEGHKKHKKKKKKKSKRHEEGGETFENPNYRTYHVDSLDNMNIQEDEPKPLQTYQADPKPLRKHARFGSDSDNESSGANVTSTTNL